MLLTQVLWHLFIKNCFNKKGTRNKYTTLFIFEKSATVVEDKSRHQESVQQTKSCDDVEANDADTEMLESSCADGNQHDAPREACDLTEGGGSQDVTILCSEVVQEAEPIKQLFVVRTESYGIPQLERLYTRVMKGIFDIKDRDDPKPSILGFLSKFAEDEANF